MAGYNDQGARAPAHVLLPVTWTLFAIATLCFVARIAVRIKFSSRLFIDDGFAFLAIILLLAHAILITTMLHSMYITVAMENLAQGTPTKRSGIDVYGSLRLFLKLQFAQTMVYWSCVWSVKASFLAFFKRLTDNLKAHIVAWWIITVITFLAYVGCVITYPVSCASFDPRK